MIKSIMAAVLLATSLQVSAIGLGNDNPPSGGGTQIQGQNQGQTQGQAQGIVSDINVSNRISNDVRTNAAAFAAGGSANSYSKSNSVSGAQSTSGGNTLVGGDTSSSINTTVNTNYPDRQRIYNVPSAVAPPVYPTAPCMGSTSVGGSGVGFGFSVGSSWTDDECGIRETARSFNGLGLKDDAVSVLCTSKYAAVAPVCARQKEKSE